MSHSNGDGNMWDFGIDFYENVPQYNVQIGQFSARILNYIIQFWDDSSVTADNVLDHVWSYYDEIEEGQADKIAEAFINSRKLSSFNEVKQVVLDSSFPNQKVSCIESDGKSILSVGDDTYIYIPVYGSFMNDLSILCFVSFEFQGKDA